MINEKNGIFTSNDRAHRSSLGLLCLLSEKEGATPSWCFGAQQKGERGEKCCRRKTAPAKNAAGEKLAPAKNAAGEICGENAAGEICRDKCTQTKLPWNFTSVRNKF